MIGFGGFPQKGRLVKVPGLFFSDLLPQIDSLAELKVTLYCIWRLQQKEGDVPFLWEREIQGDDGFLSGLGARDDERRAALADGLERAVSRGTLLHARLKRGGGEESLYLMNTARGRAAIEGLEQGKWQPEGGGDRLFDLTIERPNVFTLYEQNIGPLTPIIADSLRDLEATYSADWVEEAIEIAAARNKRSMAYIEGILRRRAEEGGADDGEAGQDWRRYLSGKYGRQIDQ
jgi:DnaD/phage-associated family protein